MFLILFIIIGHICLYTGFLPLLEVIYTDSLILCFIYLIIKNLRLHQELNGYILIFLSYYFIIIISSYINNVIYWGNLLKPLIEGISIILFLNVYYQKDSEKTLLEIQKVLSIYILLNLLLVIVKPDGLWIETSLTGSDRNKYLIGGSYNQMAPLLFCGVLISYITYCKFKRSIVPFFIISISSIITLLIVGSKTAIVGIILLIFTLNVRKINIKRYIILVLIAYYFLFQITFVFESANEDKNKLIAYFVEDFLGKDLTFSTRTTIWFWTLYTIFRSPIIGFGIQDSQWSIINIQGISTHNFILNVLLQGGLLLFIWFLIYIIFLYYIYKKKSKDSLNINILSSICIFFIMMIMEVYNISYLILLTGLFYYNNTNLGFRNYNKYWIS